MAAKTVPVIMIGKTADVGRVVEKNLKPEYEVIHFFTDVEVAEKDLPLLLDGKKPNTASAAGVGSGDYSRSAEAVLLGAYFTNSMVSSLRKYCTNSKIPWITAGLDEEQRDRMLAAPMPSPDVYGPKSAGKVKSALERVRKEGGWGRDGVYVQ